MATYSLGGLILPTVDSGSSNVPLESHLKILFQCLDFWGKTKLKDAATVSDWWFGTFFIFPYIGNNHPN